MRNVIRIDDGWLFTLDGKTETVNLPHTWNATVVYSKIADSYLPSEIEGEKGNLLMSGIHVIHDVTFIPHRKPMSGQGPEEERQTVGVEIDKSDYFYETAEFIDLVEKGKSESENNSWENSYNTLRVTDEIRRQLGVVFPTDSAK